MILGNDVRTVLVNLPWRADERLGVRAGSRWPFTSPPEDDGKIHYIPFPFFLAYTAAVLRRADRPVTLIDAIAQEMDEHVCLETIKGYHPGLVVAETSTPSFRNDIRIMNALRTDLAEVRLGLCGPLTSDAAVEILKEERSVIDYVLVGEYEFTVLELVECVSKGKDLSAVRGLVHRVADRIIVNDPRPALDDLDRLPWPERSAPLIYQYNDAFAGLPSPNVQMWASRGCPFHCSFCLWPQTIYQGSRYRQRKAADVVDEMEHVLTRFNVKAVYFDDDIFNADRKHVLDICAEIVKRSIKVPWAMMARVELTDDELICALSKAGLYAIKYGIESADETVLKRCKKDLDLDLARSVIRKTKKAGIKVHLTFCIGLPGDTEQAIRKTMDFIEQEAPDSIQFSFATPFPGTAYYQEVIENGWLSSAEGSGYDGKTRPLARNEILSAEDLENLMRELKRRFDRSVVSE